MFYSIPILIDLFFRMTFCEYFDRGLKHIGIQSDIIRKEVKQHKK